MAKMPEFAILQNGDYTKIEKAIAQEKLKSPAYIYDAVTSQLIFVNKDGTYTFIKGSNKPSVIKVNELPSTGEEDVLYVYNDIVCYWDSEDQCFYPTYRKLEESIDGIEEAIDNVEEIKRLLENFPITQLEGTAFEPIHIEDLPDGIYSIIGQYQIRGIDTVFINTANTLFLVKTANEKKYATNISGDGAEIYEIGSNETKKDVYITESYLSENNYMTESDVTSLVSNLIEDEDSDIHESVNNQIESQIESIVTDATPADINGLFNN